MCDPAVSFLGIYLEKTIISKEICTQMFTAALFTIAKMWYIYTMKYYSAIKRYKTAICTDVDISRDCDRA